MKKVIYSLIITILFAISTLGISYAYTFGMLSHDDTIESIQAIETTHNITLPMISFIRDDYNTQAQDVISRLWSTLGTGRVYHITLSPHEYTAEQVVGGYFDREYGLLFKNIKRTGIKVIFRTMHEMNGWRYPRSGNPEHFKKARIHIHQLAREAGLNQSQILFDFSTNGWDMPTKGWELASQSAHLITCTQQHKKQSSCLTREDYYPWDEYVDLMGVTFYNRGKATSNRQRLNPWQIMEESRFTIWKRLVNANKPIIIDEVGTSSIWYEWTYDRTTSLQHYKSNSGHILKNIRLGQLAAWARSKPQIAALSYFNVDRTIGLAWENPWEADRSTIDLSNGRYYSSIMRLYQWWEQNLIKLFITAEQKRKEGIGTWKKGAVKKKTTTKTNK